MTPAAERRAKANLILIQTRVAVEVTGLMQSSCGALATDSEKQT